MVRLLDVLGQFTADMNSSLKNLGKSIVSCSPSFPNLDLFKSVVLSYRLKQWFGIRFSIPLIVCEFVILKTSGHSLMAQPPLSFRRQDHSLRFMQPPPPPRVTTKNSLPFKISFTHDTFQNLCKNKAALLILVAITKKLRNINVVWEKFIQQKIYQV